VAVNGDLPLTMVFLKDNRVIQTDDEVYTIKQNDDFTLTLSMSKISERENGIFECRVENEGGVATHSSELRVNG
jgi:Immunoglobulin I-set domain